VEEKEAHQVLQLGLPVHNRDYQDNLRVQPMRRVVDCLKGEAGGESHVEEKQAH
jgi:hypothetical protein